MKKLSKVVGRSLIAFELPLSLLCLLLCLFFFSSKNVTNRCLLWNVWGFSLNKKWKKVFWGSVSKWNCTLHRCGIIIKYILFKNGKIISSNVSLCTLITGMNDIPFQNQPETLNTFWCSTNELVYKVSKWIKEKVPAFDARLLSLAWS